MRKSLTLLPVAALFSACSAPDAVSLGTERQALIGGHDSTDDENAVVLIVYTDQATHLSTCTGTLIAPNLVLTARHCVSSIKDGLFACNEKGQLTPSSQGGRLGADHAVEQLFVFKGTKSPLTSYETAKASKPSARAAKIFHDVSDLICGHDLAIMLLDKDIEEAPIMPIRLEGTAKRGEKVTAVGWGVTRSGNTPGIRQTRSGIPVLKLGPAGIARDSPQGLTANDFEVGESICAGDSGGPAIAEETRAVVGVASRGGNGSSDESNPALQCTGSDAFNIFTSLAPFRNVIESAFSAADHEPWLENGPDPRLAKFDEHCTDDSACRSSICVDAKCTQACESDDDCPSGNACASRGDSKVCRVPAPPPAPVATPDGCSLGAAEPVVPVLPWFGVALAGLVSLGRRLRRTRSAPARERHKRKCR